MSSFDSIANVRERGASAGAGVDFDPVLGSVEKTINPLSEISVTARPSRW